MAPEQVVERAREFFEGVGHGYALLALEGLDDDLIYHLGESDANAPEMVMTQPPQPVDLPDGFELKVVETSRERELFIETAGEAFETLGEAPGTWDLCYPTGESLANPASLAMVLYEGGQPAATGMYYRNDDVIEISPHRHPARLPSQRLRKNGDNGSHYPRFRERGRPWHPCRRPQWANQPIKGSAIRPSRPITHT